MPSQHTRNIRVHTPLVLTLKALRPSNLLEEGKGSGSRVRAQSHTWLGGEREKLIEMRECDKAFPCSLGIFLGPLSTHTHLDS